MKKDDYLENLMMIPPKQKMDIKPFSQKTTREAFSVSLEGLKGVCSVHHDPVERSLLSGSGISTPWWQNPRKLARIGRGG